jgi:NADPH2:quinone reductase
MSHVIEIQQFGGPEVLQWVERPVPAVGAGEVRIRHAAVGLNFIEVYQRTGLYPNVLPLVPGTEAAGVVEEVGAGVTHLSPGDRVAYATSPPGAYSQCRVMPAQSVVQLPDGIDFETAAAMMLKGLTVQYLLRSTQPVGGLQPGDFVLWHAAAGGVGLIACQWAQAMGLQLIGTASSQAKCELALAHGASHAINYSSEDFVARLREITAGKGVKVVYDAIGKDTFERSLNCLSPFGLMVSFGNASGVVPPIAIGQLAAKGSLYLTRPTLFTHAAQPGRLQAMADDLFELVGSGAVRIRIDQRFALRDAAQAHRALESRATTGCTVLLP